MRKGGKKGAGKGSYGLEAAEGDEPPVEVELPDAEAPSGQDAFTFSLSLCSPFAHANYFFSLV